jgi:hypothetical protein
MKIIFPTFFILLLSCSIFSQTPVMDCVRSVPEPILMKSVFPTKTFTKTKNKENTGETIGFEKVKVNKNVDLTIKNYGCENYTLTFQFLVGNQSQRIGDTKFWYDKAFELMNLVKKGIRREDINLINRGLKAISNYRKKTKNPKYENHIDFGGKEIRDVVVLERVVRQGKKHKVEISFGVGPL